MPRLHGPLASPSDARAVQVRGRFLIEMHSHLFNRATPEETTAALFAGWTRCGLRVGDAPDGRHVFVWRRGTQWVGLQFDAEVEDPPTPIDPNTDPVTIIDYLPLMHRRRRNPIWDSLTGAERLQQVLDGLACPSANITTGPVDFLASLATRFRLGSLFVVRSIEPWREMANIVMTEDLPDPDGELASARMLAALANPGLIQDGSMRIITV